MSIALDLPFTTGFTRQSYSPKPRSSDHVAADEIVIRLGDEQYRLYAVVDLETNELRHTAL